MKDKVVIAVNEGKIRGIKRKSSFSGAEYHSFLGVPYGQSTAGYGRFKDPVKVKPWSNVLDCTKEKDGCLQFAWRKRTVIGSEDCLYNNIHTPELPAKDKPLKTVIVCYHPAGLTNGGPDPWYYGSPEYVMHHDIVYVCVAFRLHILGFLNLGLEECSGNQGLKDIILSLQWIKENIRAFGGDAENITLMGSSTSAGLVNDLMIIPQAKQLFHKVLLMGMYRHCPLHPAPEENTSLAYKIATQLGYINPDKNDRKKLLAFYKRLLLNDVLSRNPNIFCRSDRVTLTLTSSFVTTIDSGEKAVLPSTSRKQQLQSMARIPVMIGFCEREASIAFLKFYKDSTMENFYELIRSNYLGWGYHLAANKIKLIQEHVEQFYLNGESIEKASLSTKCDILTDAALSDVYDSLINVIAADLPSSVFVYKFCFEGNALTMNEYFSSHFEEPLKGTPHGADYSHWALSAYKWSSKTDSLTSKTREVVETFTKYITTFAKTGNPNYQDVSIQWLPSTKENPTYLRIDDPLKMVEEKLNGKRVEFWEDLKHKCLNE